MPLRPIEEIKSPRIGRFYLVETVLVNSSSLPFLKSGIVPVNGPKHNDPEIGFKPEHYHIDWRFVSDKHYTRALKYADGLTMPWIRVLIADQAVRVLGRQEMEYRRHFKFEPRFKYKVLEEKYKDAKMTKGICPHRGIPCEMSTAQKDGVIICPGHGLAWSVLDGRMVPRAQRAIK